MNVQGKTIVVTGGGNGMGRELTLLLLKKGARVAAVDINELTLKETAALAGDHQAGGKMCYSNGTICLLHMLSAWTARPKGIDFQIIGIYPDICLLFGFGKDFN